MFLHAYSMCVCVPTVSCIVVYMLYYFNYNIYCAFIIITIFFLIIAIIIVLGIYFESVLHRDACGST